MPALSARRRAARNSHLGRALATCPRLARYPVHQMDKHPPPARGGHRHGADRHIKKLSALPASCGTIPDKPLGPGRLSLRPGPRTCTRGERPCSRVGGAGAEANAPTTRGRQAHHAWATAVPHRTGRLATSRRAPALDTPQGCEPLKVARTRRSGAGAARPRRTAPTIRLPLRR